MAFRFEKLEIWQEANRYAHEIYKITKKFPRAELFSLSDQLKRAANSIAANIAEGSGSHSKKDFINYLNIAIKSTYETVALIFRAEQEGYVNDKIRKSVYEQAEILIKRIQSFKRTIRHKP
jgi:four helix bundle protein